MPLIAVLLWVLVANVFVACGTGSSGVSRLLHTWGETTRGKPPAGVPAQCPFSDPADPAVAHLRTLAGRIAQHNPQTFRGALAVSNLCLGVNASWDEPEARTRPESKTIYFSPAMFLVAQNDDELAAVLSHELAHITLQHSGFGEHPPRAAHDPEFQQLSVQASAVQSEIVALAKMGGRDKEIFALNETFAQLQKQMNVRIDAVYGEANAHLNWFEQEADEVGAEFFVKAGFKRESYLAMLWRTSSAPQTYESCQKLISGALERGEKSRPERGNKVHPNTCWRAFHLKVDEWAHAHRAEIDTLARR